MKHLIVLFATVLAIPIAAAPSDCRMFEVEVAAVDPSGEFHRLFNFAQSLPVGESWSMNFPRDAGTLKVSVAWEGKGSEQTPRLTLTLHTSEPAGTIGRVVLEKLVWDSLLGPEAFETAEGKPVAMSKYGRPFAVASVVSTRCSQ